MIWIKPYELKYNILYNLSGDELKENEEIYDQNIDEYFDHVVKLAKLSGFEVSFDDDQSTGGNSIWAGDLEWDSDTEDYVNGKSYSDLNFFINYEIPEFWNWVEKKELEHLEEE